MRTTLLYVDLPESIHPRDNLVFVSLFVKSIVGQLMPPGHEWLIWFHLGLLFSEIHLYSQIK